MRLWTIHPRFLDAKGLVSLWREGLLAKAVLEGKTQGYQKHPQLMRFKEHNQPLDALLEYLRSVLHEAQNRDYHFDGAKLPSRTYFVEQIEESQGQLEFEWRHLLNKLSIRNTDHYRLLSYVKVPEAHPLFYIVPGGIKNWEKAF
ncbi:pyrimidine dimer DNA glycosylase/endonuclease V [Thermodesulfobacteriota bacterium]